MRRAPRPRAKPVPSRCFCPCDCESGRSIGADTIEDVLCTRGALSCIPVRSSASFVQVGEGFVVTCDDGREEELRRLRIRREAPCLRIEAGRAEEFLDHLDSIGDLEARVQNAKIKFNADGTGTLSYANKTVPCLGKVGF